MCSVPTRGPQPASQRAVRVGTKRLLTSVQFQAKFQQRAPLHHSSAPPCGSLDGQFLCGPPVPTNRSLGALLSQPLAVPRDGHAGQRTPMVSSPCPSPPSHPLLPSLVPGHEFRYSCEKTRVIQICKNRLKKRFHQLQGSVEVPLLQPAGCLAHSHSPGVTGSPDGQGSGWLLPLHPCCSPRGPGPRPQSCVSSRVSGLEDDSLWLQLFLWFGELLAM